jgi:hypothetical protein
LLRHGPWLLQDAAAQLDRLEGGAGRHFVSELQRQFSLARLEQVLMPAPPAMHFFCISITTSYWCKLDAWSRIAEREMSKSYGGLNVTLPYRLNQLVS